MTFLLRRLSALLLLPLAACSSTQAHVAPLPPPANLRAECPVLPEPPQTLIDPERLEWEVDVVLRYEECRAKHRALVKALPEPPSEVK